jgi:hypothetical protein
MASPKEMKEARLGQFFNKRIKSIQVRIECEECKKVFETTAHIHARRSVCDCDYPCDCKNGTFYYLVADCPHCKSKNDIFSLGQKT